MRLKGRRGARGVGALGFSKLGERNGRHAAHDVPFREVGWARSLPAPVAVAGLETLTADAFLEKLLQEKQTDLTKLANFGEASHVLYDPKGGYGSAEAAALHFGHGAVREGADLLLNARATLTGPNTLTLERLEFARDMQRKVVKREVVEAGTLIVAAGAWSAALIEDGLGEVLPVGRVYMQYPRVEADKRLKLGTGLEAGRVAMPRARAQGLHPPAPGRGPAGGPAMLPPDPAGYLQRAELLWACGRACAANSWTCSWRTRGDLPLLEWDTLNLGKTVSKFGALWEVLTGSGGPEWAAGGGDGLRPPRRAGRLHPRFGGGLRPRGGAGGG